MQSSLNTPRTESSTWIYASLTVIDGERRLKPTQVAFDRMWFSSPPRLTGGRVEIILVNGDAEQRHVAEVLPHEAEATWIPIRLVENR